MKRRIVLFMMGAGLVLVGMGLWQVAQPAEALTHPPLDDSLHPFPFQTGGDESEREFTLPDGVEITGDNSYCELCHAQDLHITFADGTQLNLQVTPDTLEGSVHQDLGCLDCHENNTYPHVTPLPATARDYTVVSSVTCTKCHTDQLGDQQDSVHDEGLARGNTRAATCTDCHGAHQVEPVVHDDPALASKTCGECHTVVFAEYEVSVHGEALLVGGDANAPSCISCHGVHGINNPTTVQARNRSPQLCADCHADEALMAEYDISTNVFDSYLSDFHGTTVSLFSQQDPDVLTNKAVCYDCHGVHNITSADDSKSQVAKENLLATCQQCHPGAEANFPDSWVGHFEPTSEDNLGLYLVNLFYQILIPVVLGGFAVLVVSDAFMRVRVRLLKDNNDDHGGTV